MAAPKSTGATGWLRGVIKEVPSGDTVVIKAATKSTSGGIAPEKRVTLASLTAPRLGRRDGSTVDEPFAWQSRDFLRRKAIGQEVVFRIDYVLEQAAGREFGSVYLGEKENLALSVVAAGWAKVWSHIGMLIPYCAHAHSPVADARRCARVVASRAPSTKSLSRQKRLPRPPTRACGPPMLQPSRHLCAAHHRPTASTQLPCLPATARVSQCLPWSSRSSAAVWFVFRFLTTILRKRWCLCVVCKRPPWDARVRHRRPMKTVEVLLRMEGVLHHPPRRVGLVLHWQRGSTHQVVAG